MTKLDLSKTTYPSKTQTADVLLRVHDNQRYFVQNGVAWPWLGDTAWNLATDYTAAEAERFLAARAASGKMRPITGLAPIDSNAATPRMIEATRVTS